MEKLTEDLIKNYYKDHKGLNVTVEGKDDYFVVEIQADEDTILSSSFYEEMILVSFFSDTITMMIYSRWHKTLLDMINEFNLTKK